MFLFVHLVKHLQLLSSCPLQRPSTSLTNTSREIWKRQSEWQIGFGPYIDWVQVFIKVDISEIQLHHPKLFRSNVTNFERSQITSSTSSRCIMSFPSSYHFAAVVYRSLLRVQNGSLTEWKVLILQTVIKCSMKSKHRFSYCL